MTDTVADRVARGAAWLDVRYPTWVDGIDLGILDIADCHHCVLGQVYTGAIPTEERGQILAQVIKSYADSTYKTESFWADRISTWGGYSILNDFYQLEQYGLFHGFLGGRDEDGANDGDYQALLDEWTRFIIQRRLDAHPDVAAPSNLDSIDDETFQVYAAAV